MMRLRWSFICNCRSAVAHDFVGSCLRESVSMCHRPAEQYTERKQIKNNINPGNYLFYFLKKEKYGD